LEAPPEGFFWNLPEFSRRIRYDVLHGCETRPLEANFQRREQPKVTWSEIRRVRWLGDDRNAFLGEELLHNKRCVSVRYRDAETTLPATCRAVSTELRRATSANLARRNDH